MDKKKLQREQLAPKIEAFRAGRQIIIPSTGWVKAIRTSLGMSLQQLANKLSISKQSVGDLESREKAGTITLKRLREAAHAMDMDLVYGLVPKAGTLEDHIEQKSRTLAQKIVSRSSNTMMLEDQEVPYGRLQKAVEDRTNQFKEDLPKALWD